MLKKREYIFWISMFCGLSLLLLSVGTVYDLQIDCALYNPENGFARFLQDYGEVPRFALWGPAARCLNKHDGVTSGVRKRCADFGIAPVLVVKIR